MKTKFNPGDTITWEIEIKKVVVVKTKEIKINKKIPVKV